jgi:hypothetical protein
MDIVAKCYVKQSMQTRCLKIKPRIIRLVKPFNISILKMVSTYIMECHTKFVQIYIIIHQFWLNQNSNRPLSSQYVHFTISTKY